MISEKKIISFYPKTIPIGFFEGFCNLRCPKCNGFGAVEKKKLVRGKMEMDQFCRLLDELEGKDIVVAGGGYSEPLLQTNWREYYREIKKRGLKINLNTNGVLLDDRCAEDLFALGVDSVFVSIDAMTKEALKKARGIEDLDTVNQAVFSLLKARGNSLSMRIGVSFVVDPDNRHERESFVQYWLAHVDAVRVAELYVNADVNRNLPERQPCPFLYNMMNIHYNGDVPICCWECEGQTNLGNVFEKGIRGVWAGEIFNKYRYYHESGQFDKIPICKYCTDWARYFYTREETKDGILIRQSPLITFYNRIDRLGTWQFNEGMHLLKEQVAD